MRNLLFLFSAIILLSFSACEEVPPAIDFSEPLVALKDSTYMVSPTPIAQHRAVLIEDITGVRCSNCPDAAKKAKDIISQKTSDSVVVMALYPSISSLNQFTFPYPDVPQVNAEISKQIVESLGVPQGLPSGFVDRKIFTGKTVRAIAYPEWINFVNERLKEKTPVNINISKIISNRNLKVEIKLQYNSSVTYANPPKYAIYLVEDKIISTQQNHSLEDPAYVHNHVLRYAFGLALGNPLAGPFDAGKTYLKQFQYEVPAAYVIPNCHVVCVVLDGTTEEVINVREIDL